MGRLSPSKHKNAFPPRARNIVLTADDFDPLTDLDMPPQPPSPTSPSHLSPTPPSTPRAEPITTTYRITRSSASGGPRSGPGAKYIKTRTQVCAGTYVESIVSAPQGRYDPKLRRLLHGYAAHRHQSARVE